MCCFMCSLHAWLKNGGGRIKDNDDDDRCCRHEENKEKTGDGTNEDLPSHPLSSEKDKKTFYAVSVKSMTGNEPLQYRLD